MSTAILAFFLCLLCFDSVPPTKVNSNNLHSLHIEQISRLPKDGLRRCQLILKHHCFGYHDLSALKAPNYCAAWLYHSRIFGDPKITKRYKSRRRIRLSLRKRMIFYESFIYSGTDQIVSIVTFFMAVTNHCSIPRMALNVEQSL